MLQSDISCCSVKLNRMKKEDREIPEVVRMELNRVGGFKALAKRIPAKKDLEEKSKVYHALSDPLRLTILYLLKDQPLCVCVINHFMQIADSKLSYHITILKESRLIEGVYHGNWIIYSLTDLGKTSIS